MQYLAPAPRTFGRNPALVLAIVALAVIGFAYAQIRSMTADEQNELLWLIQDYLPFIMFLSLATLLFSGFPVALILGGLALLFGLIGDYLDTFSLIGFFDFMPRIWFQGAENLVLVSVPAFVFVGVMMERGGVANDLLYRVPARLNKVAESDAGGAQREPEAPEPS